MKRSGFTMIELIFVIVILGILAAVALPKFIGVSEQAQVGKVKGYVGSLNRTVAPSLWSESISKATVKGSVKDNTVVNFDDKIKEQLPPLEAINDDGTDMNDIVLANCAAAAAADGTPTAPATGVGTIATMTIGTQTYNIGCIDGNMNQAPVFFLEDGTTVILK